jgi:hypothetical protein
VLRPSTESPATDLRPEVELLLCCARTHIDSTNARRIRALVQQGVDWGYLTAMACRHGTLPLLNRGLNATCPDAVPEAVLAQLREHFEANARRNLFLTGELLRLLHLLDAHGIVAVPFKGPVLAETVYGNLALRQFIDLDILVHERHVPQAEDLLISQGYRLWAGQAEAQETARSSPGYEYTFMNGNKNVTVDLHWEIMNGHIPFPLDLERLWDRLESISLGGTTVYNLGPEDLLLILCAHGSKHGPISKGRLIWICDVAELISVHPELDWAQVTKRASRLGSQRMLYLGLFLARDLLGTVLPGEIWERVKADPVVASLASQVRERLFTGADVPLQSAEKHAFYIRMRERWRDRLSCLLYLVRERRILVPNAKDHAFLPLPASFSFLYYLLRPVRLVREYRQEIRLLSGLVGGLDSR